MSITYTPSAISDGIVKFFNTYRVGFEAKYLRSIDADPLLQKTIVIDYNDFTEKIREMLNDKSKQEILAAFERAIGEVFATRHGDTALTQMKKEGGIKFKFINWEKFEPESTFSPTIKNLECDELENTKKSTVDKIMDFIYSKAVKIVRSKEDSSRIYARMEINGDYETFEINENSVSLVLWLKTKYKKETGNIWPTESFKQAIDLVKGEVIYGGNTPCEKIHNRIAFDGKTYYYDLCSPDNKLVKITKDETSIISQDKDTPLFIKSQLQAKQVLPNFDFTGNPLGEWCKLNRINTHYAIHLIAYFFPELTCAIACLDGPSGSFKSTTSGQTKRMIDPKGEDTNEDQKYSIPKNIDDLILNFYNNYFVTIDNVSYITDEHSDFFCKVVTGSLFTKRKHYQDLEEIMMKIKRKILINGIGPNLNREDIVSRTIIYQTKIPTEQETLTDEEVEEKFVKLRPDILGQIFFTIMKVIEIGESVTKEIIYKKRMASFLVVGEAISRALGNISNEYVNWFQAQAETAITQSNETNPLIPWLNSMKIEKKQNPIHSIQIQTFQRELSIFAENGNYDTTAKGVPRKSRHVRTYLERMSRILDQNGYKYDIIDKYTENHPDITKGSAAIVFSKKITQETLGDKQ